jgi:hypothetical protein
MVSRVYMLKTYSVPDPQGGGPSLYHAGHQFEVDPAMATAMLLDGYAVQVVDGVPVMPEPEPEPQPEPVVEPEPDQFTLTEEVD